MLVSLTFKTPLINKQCKYVPTIALVYNVATVCSNNNPWLPSFRGKCDRQIDRQTWMGPYSVLHSCYGMKNTKIVFK
jgi:hypothetical protein